MVKSKVDKFKIEAHSLLVNLKIAIQELRDNNQSSSAEETVKQILTQLAQIAGLHGINSVMELSNNLLDVVAAITRNEIEPDQNYVDTLQLAEIVLEKIVQDPMLKEENHKKEYQQFNEQARKLISDNAASDTGSSKMATDKFQEVFIEEAFDLINQLEEKMLQLESDLDDAEMIDQVFRIMHTLKGNSNMFGYVHLAEITHELENIYDSIRDQKIELSRDILQNTLNCIDHFRNLIEDPELSNESVKDEHTEMVESIREILSTDSKRESGGDKTSSVSSDKGLHTYYIYFNPGPDVLDNGTNPLYFVYDLYELGECLVIPFISNACKTPDFNPEKCYTSWQILLASDSDETDINEHFMFLQEESQPFVQVLSDGDLLKNTKFIEHFTSQATGSNKKLKLQVENHIEAGAKKKSEHAAKTNEQKGGSKESISSVRVASQKIDQMMNLISELVTKQAELTMIAGAQDNQRLIEVAESIENISRDLRDNAFSISLIPLEKSVLRFQRLVRDVSNRFDKKVNFIVEGKETELDKTIIEKIVDPIMHILRNSIDHGIETPDVRRKKGKPETGTIRLKAYPSGAHVVIEISDDGAGINLDKVKKTAIKKGMISSTEQIQNEDLLNLIVSPGFSTAENISEVSGRGVGMDVVNQKISEIRGELEISTEQDKGTVISISLPLTISIIDSLLLKCSGDYFLVPLGVVDRCAEIKARQVLNNENNYVVLSDEYIPYVDLRTEFEMEGERPDIQQILLVRHKELIVGLVVDEVIGNYQAVLKALGEAYKKQEIISGASILGSGEIALVLDTSKIIQEYNAKNELKINAMA